MAKLSKYFCFPRNMKLSLQPLLYLRSGWGRQLNSAAPVGAGTASLSYSPPDPSQVQSRGQPQSQLWQQDFCQDGSTPSSLRATRSLRAAYRAASPYSTMQYAEQIVSSGGERICMWQLRCHRRHRVRE